MGDNDHGGDPACWAHLDSGAKRTSPASPGLAVTDTLLASLARQAADGVIVADRTGTIVFWNAAAARIFGWSASEAVGTSLDLIIPERHRAAHWAGYEQVMASGQTRYGDELLQVPAVSESGTRLSVAFTVTLLHDDDGAVSGIAAIVRDETARRAAERELRDQLVKLQTAAGA